MDFPIKNGDFPIAMLNYQRVNQQISKPVRTFSRRSVLFPSSGPQPAAQNEAEDSIWEIKQQCLPGDFMDMTKIN